MEFCKICGEMLDANGICPACYARMARERQQVAEPPAEQPKRTEAKPVQTRKRKPQNSLKREQNSLGDKQPKKKSKGHLWIGLAAGLVVILCALLLLPLPEMKNSIPEFVADNYDQAGICGEDVQWRFEETTGKLTIIGSGAMENYKSDSDTHRTTAPWGALPIKSVDIQDVTAIGEYAFYYCDSLTEITIPGSVTTIGADAFSDCDSLEEITISGSVTTIGAYAFSNCDRLKEVTIGGSVTSIGACAFSSCGNLMEITISGSVTTIGDSAFYDCNSLTEITIPGSVTSIGANAFSLCYSLKEITIPGSVTSIGTSAFSDCSSLTDVYFAGTEEQWNAIESGVGNWNLTSATIHYNS